MTTLLIFLLSCLLVIKTIGVYSEQLDKLSINMQVVVCGLIGATYGVAAVLLIEWLGLC